MQIDSAFEDDRTFECSESDEQWRYCAEFDYYKTPVLAFFYSKDDYIQRAVLEAEGTISTLSQLQYNLRRDGFEIAQLTHSGEVFDVKHQVEVNTLESVDQALIEFVNRHHSDMPFKMTLNKVGSQSLIQVIVRYRPAYLSLTFSRD